MRIHFKKNLSFLILLSSQYAYALPINGFFYCESKQNPSDNCKLFISESNRQTENNFYQYRGKLFCSSDHSENSYIPLNCGSYPQKITNFEKDFRCYYSYSTLFGDGNIIINLFGVIEKTSDAMFLSKDMWSGGVESQEIQSCHWKENFKDFVI